MEKHIELEHGYVVIPVIKYDSLNKTKELYDKMVEEERHKFKYKTKIDIYKPYYRVLSYDTIDLPGKLIVETDDIDVKILSEQLQKTMNELREKTLELNQLHRKINSTTNYRKFKKLKQTINT